MLPNMKFYVVSIVAIFTALGLGIYIGFSMDTEGFITDQQENLVNIVETQFESIINENQTLLEVNEGLLTKNKERNSFINESYDLLVPEKLEGMTVALIETNEDYASSSIGYSLEKAGANVVNLTTIKTLDGENVKKLTKAILSGENIDLVKNLNLENKIKSLGNYKSKPDYIVLCGGASSEKTAKVSQIDKLIIDAAKEEGVNLVGLEKSYAGNSYISRYKEYGISTVDNIDMKMGKIATVLSLKLEKGNFGVKGTAESILPIK